MTKDEALKLALEALESCDEGDWSTGHVIHPSYDEDAVAKAINAIKEALAQPEPKNIERHEANVQKFLGAPQPEQEPVAWLHQNRFTGKATIIWDLGLATPNQNWKPLYTTPPQRTWVGLTDDELDRLPTHLSSRSKRRLYCTIEAKLKQKNGYAEEKNT